VSFWLGIFVFFARVLAYFQGVPELGPVLAERLLGMVLLTFFSILLFSNIITALSSYYLATDLPLLLASPVPPSRLHAARFAETLWDSSWMILMFGFPVFLAYGFVHSAGPAYYATTLAVLAPLVVIPCALGVTITMLLVRAFPARNTKDVFLLLSVIAVALLYTFLRFLQPEQLLKPEAFADFLDFLAAVQTPTSPWLPSTWAAQTLIPFLAPRRGQTPLFDFLCLASTAAASFTLCAMIAERVYSAGWSRAQEGRRARITRLPLWDRLFFRIPGISPAARALVLKDVKTFFRDTTQWSQLILLGALVVVYVYNFQVIPRVGGVRAQLFLDQALAFLNLSLAGFVVASIAVRFLFPGISLEGKSFWLLRSSPIRLRLVWWSKFWSHVVPLLGLGILLVVLGNRALGAGAWMTALSITTLALMTLSIAALGLCVGSIYPRFDYEHAAKIPSSFGGVVYMILAVSLIGLNVVLEAWPMYVILFARLGERALTTAEMTGVGLSAAAVLLLDLGVFVGATRIGIRRLEAIQL
ncbi:MAG: putative ABC transporter permease subunit, partial [Candidatus Binatia bacterium]